MWFRPATRLAAGCPKTAMAPKRRATAPSAAVQPADEAARPAPKRAKGSRKAASSTSEHKDDGDAISNGAAAAAHPTQAPAYYLMKSEPDVFSIDDLASRPKQTEPWDGVRNHMAKKVLQAMRLGDQAFFYHSNAKPPGIVGIVEVVREAYPDHTQFDSSSKYYDARSQPDNPRWFMVDVKLVRRLQRQIPLEELKSHGGAGGPLADMALVKFGRLSVQHVTPAQWGFVLGLEERQPEEGGG